MKGSGSGVRTRAAAGVLVFREPLTAEKLAGVACIIGAVALLETGRSERMYRKTEKRIDGEGQCAFLLECGQMPGASAKQWTWSGLSTFSPSPSAKPRPSASFWPRIVK